MSERANASNTEHRMETLGQSTDTGSAKTLLQDYAATNCGYRRSDDGFSRGVGLPFVSRDSHRRKCQPRRFCNCEKPTKPLTSPGMNTGASQFASKEQRPISSSANTQQATENGEPRATTQDKLREAQEEPTTTGKGRPWP
ncbi:hypothetical protein DL770_011694 [Monosporascus sp. CRB-9-2]|nr:hypothetical protein DL770_011694 [Monosporascus sp. CRB-9-2]